MRMEKYYWATSVARHIVKCLPSLKPDQSRTMILAFLVRFHVFYVRNPDLRRRLVANFYRDLANLGNDELIQTLHDLSQ